ncbi:MAG: MFS transporter [Deferrisomatales bacterium]|nr:MFS transporter [Deferrisomatales bacterium]
MSDDLLTKARRYRWLIFWVLALGYVLVYFHRLCPAVVAVDMMRDLEAGGVLVGLLGSAYFYPYAIMQLPAGLLSDSWGPRRTVTVFFLVAVVGSALLATAHSVGWAITGRVLVGFGVSMLFVPTMKVLAEWFRPTEFATMTGILMAMGGLGSLAAATPLAAMAAWVGWRASFGLVGVATLGLAVAVWLLVRDRPADLGWPSPAAAGDDPQREAPPAIPLGAGVKRVVSDPWFWVLAVWFFFDCAVFFTFGGLWGGPYLMQVYGMTRQQAGHVLSMLAVGMVVGSPAVSSASNRVFRARKPVMVSCAALTLGITGVLALFTDTLPVPALYAVCLGLGIFSSAVVVVGFTMAKELFPVRMAGTATGLVNLFPFAGGAVFQPILGSVLEHYGRVEGAFTVTGYRAAFTVLAGCALVTLVASAFLKETLATSRA